MKSLYATADILEQLAAGITQRRIDANLTQAELAGQSGVSKRTVERLEGGAAVQSDNLLAVLHRLDLLEPILALLPSKGTSPVQAVKSLNREKPRQRVRNANSVNESSPVTRASDWQWGDEK